MRMEILNTMLDWLKGQAQIVTSLGVLLGAAGGIIVLFGGSFPPWYTPTAAAKDQQTSAEIQKQTVATLNSINDKLTQLQSRVDQRDCVSLVSTMEQAQSALRKNAADPLARALRDNTAVQMRQIQGCAP